MGKTKNDKNSEGKGEVLVLDWSLDENKKTQGIVRQVKYDDKVNDWDDERLVLEGRGEWGRFGQVRQNVGWGPTMQGFM